MSRSLRESYVSGCKDHCKNESMIHGDDKVLTQLNNKTICTCKCIANARA